LLEFEREVLLIVWNDIKERKIRSFLTMLGIAIGIAAIISLVSVGEGLKNAIMRQVEQFGANKIIVMPFAEIGRGPSLGTSYFIKRDVERVEKVKGVDIAAPFLIKTLEVSYKGENKFSMVTGIEPEKSKRMFEDVQGYELEAGRFFGRNDKNSVILGNAVAHDMFEDEIEIGDRVKIGDEKFKVVGIFKEIGNRIDDSMIVVPMDKLRELTNSEEEVTLILVGANDADRVDDVAKRIEKTLEKYYERGTFTVLTSQQLAERLKMISLTLTVFLGGIASISLIVAGIGIANTMLMTIMERTREIGIMKAIGATNKDVMKIFLIESIALSVVGGILGCIFGVVGSKALSKYSFATGVTLRTAITPTLLLFGLVFSIVVGVLFGLWPAYKAAKLNPVEALRYE